MNAASPLRSAVDAALVMLIGMGFGRFAFTALYPQMVDEGLISLAEGSWAASVNYAGYLLGALLGMRARAASAHRLCLWAMLGTAFCLAILGVLQSAPVLILVRGVAGVFSALAMIAASLWLLEQRRQARSAPLLYAGVGVGIAVSAELLALGAWAGLRSGGLWLLLGGVSLLAGLLAARGLAASGPETVSDSQPVDTAPLAAVRPAPLVMLYGLAGFGYIITATYLPTLVKGALPDLDPAHVWAVFGAGAAPSCFLWYRLHHRIGTRRALFWNLLLQAIGVIVPVFLANAAGYLLSAALVGATFTGTVTIAMPAAQRIARLTNANLAARMTLAYGAGQIAGPLVAGALYRHSHSFSLSLVAAATALAAAGVMSLLAL
ncbi:YbfB/YjiJ family MFS transporter [Janthinobacterium sp. 1_2014MBL_MicDiv]|uniref:YbfB/YjiJ family MFS transporter n=1 Tax=Janthinobacterium sp. 1_2014MBL_MicDiv TaxID=1644131 RepID=UPI0008F47CC1|nr:YbfB/YjiJ family MFS transporter [Janthinobacterium sp. 1_2014MBL_MicDiv]APA67684.1 sugar transporter [Janthinobacterium sp. 1_2014MBL_MicDiv]